jgi:hypothetical protein
MAAGFGVWLRAADGTLVNVERVDCFSIGENPPGDPWTVVALQGGRPIVLCEHEDEEHAKLALGRLAYLLDRGRARV